MPRLNAAAIATAILLISACSKADNSAATSDAGAGQDQSWSPARLASVEGVPSAAIESALRAKLAGAPPAKIDDDQWAHTKRLYKAYGNNPLWLSPDGLHRDRTFALANAVLQTEQDGMRMDAYPVGALAQSIAAVQQTKTPTAEQLADADLILTSSFAAIGEDYLTGQVDPKSVAQSWHIDPQEENVDSALIRSLRNPALDKAIATMRPADPDYSALRKELDRFQQITVKGGWPQVPAGAPAKPGERMSPQRIAALRTRLSVEGIAVPEAAAPAGTATTGKQATTSTGVYDHGLAGAVAQFQARHGIAVDSMLGAETLTSLNQTAVYRTAQIAANLERLRWLPRNFGNRYIYVNVPAFRVEAVEKGKPTLEMKVIVGQDYEDKATPVFSDSMETVVFRPYWNVTPDIAEKEVFPKMNADPGYLDANNYELYKEGGATRVRQKPGAKNSLGLVKFLFPNDFNIYLHDTPNHELFNKDVRAFSHGCIRVEKPTELAEWVLGWDAAKVESAMQGPPDNNAVKVPRKIPVYITYGTAYIKDGQLYFGNDLYDRDDKLVAQVLRGALPSSEMVQAVQALRRIAAR